MAETDSSDEDLVVGIDVMKKQVLLGSEYCANNNNDVDIAKVFSPNESYIGSDHQLISEKNDLCDMTLNGIGYQSVENGGKSLEEVVHNCRNSRETDQSGLDPGIGDENLEQYSSKQKTSENSHDNCHMLRKNHTFPLQTSEAKFLEELGVHFKDNLLKNPNFADKRLLPPIDKVPKKKNRTFSDTSVDFEPDSFSRLPVIQGSPVKKVEENDSKDSKIKFHLGDDLSDDEIYDTSTSSGQDLSSSSSSLDSVDAPVIDDSKPSNKLEDQLLCSLKLEELRYSPTNSTRSAPCYEGNKLSSGEEDIKSICSDSRVVRKHKLKRKNLHQGRTKETTQEAPVSSYEIRNGGYMADLEEEEGERLKVKSSLGQKIEDYEEDDVISVAQSMSSSGGVLPALPVEDVRDRNYLVGKITKHSSLLGPDELHRYFPDRLLKLFVGTWNMQRKGVPRSLNDFLLPEKEEYLQDMYVIGIQESTQDQKKWEIKLQETLGPNHVMAHSVSHGVLHLAVFVRRDLIWFCSPFEEDRVTTRMVSQIKTKGAVAISFNFFGTSMVFVTSHFHSGETRVKERVEDYNRIREKLKLPKQVPNSHKGSPNDVTTRFDCVFWFGDLNFRVSQPHEIIKNEVKNPEKYNLKEVLKGDQLTATKRRGRIFCGFTEPKIKFLPTYKFNPGTDEYDTSTKLRVPSYTDRILYKSKDGMISCSRYDSITTMKKSDHRPVYALFEVSLKPGRDSGHLGGGRFRRDVYEKAARLRAQGNYQNSSAVCSIL